MPTTLTPAEQSWLLADGKQDGSAVSKFLARPLIVRRGHNRHDGAVVLDGLATGLADARPALAVLNDMRATLEPSAQLLCADLMTSLRAGASLSRSLAAHPDAFGKHAGALLEAYSALTPLPSAVRAVAQAHTARGLLSADLRSRAWTASAVSALAALAAIVATVLGPALDSTWGAIAAVTAQVAGSLTLLAAIVILLGQRTRHGRRYVALLLDPGEQLAGAAADREGYLALSLLIGAGTPARTALDVAVRTVTHPRARARFTAAAAAVNQGVPLAAALAEHVPAPHLDALAGCTTPGARAAVLLQAAHTEPLRIGRPQLLYLAPPAALAALAWAGALGACVVAR